MKAACIGYSKPPEAVGLMQSIKSMLDPKVRWGQIVSRMRGFKRCSHQVTADPSPKGESAGGAILGQATV
jgi:hypothetical protein